MACSPSSSTRADPADVLHSKPGQRVRLRIINAGSDTLFTVAVGGHRLTITHTDGYTAQSRETDAFYIGMANATTPS